MLLQRVQLRKVIHRKARLGEFKIPPTMLYCLQLLLDLSINCLISSYGASWAIAPKMIILSRREYILKNLYLNKHSQGFVMQLL